MKFCFSVVISICFLSTITLARSQASEKQLLFDDPVIKAVIKSSETKYGIYCNIKDAKTVKTAQGYYSDYTFFVTIPCGKPSKSAHFESLTLRFFALLTEMEGDLHLACIEKHYTGADFGFDESLPTCALPEGFEKYKL